MKTKSFLSVCKLRVYQQALNLGYVILTILTLIAYIPSNIYYFENTFHVLTNQKTINYNCLIQTPNPPILKLRNYFLSPLTLLNPVNLLITKPLTNRKNENYPYGKEISLDIEQKLKYKRKKNIA